MIIRAIAASGVAVILTASFIATPAIGTPVEAHTEKAARASDRGPSKYELNKRGENRRINSKRTGKGSVKGASELRTKAKRWAPHKRVRLMTAHSSDGTNAGFQGVTTVTVRASGVDTVIAKAEADKKIVSIEVDSPVKALETHDAAYPGGGVYYQWALDTLRAPNVWSKATGAGVKVAVLDTGVQGDHPDLFGQLLPGKDFVGDGYHAYEDPNGHGTHVAGIVSAKMNSVGITGLAPHAQIIPIRVLDAYGSGYLSDVINGIKEAADLGADVINMSLGGPGTSTLALDEAVAMARNAGTTVLAAGGNTGNSQIQSPASTPGVIGVGSTTINDERSSFSTHNSSVDVSAPGSGVMSTYKYNNYSSMSGTSMATPYAAATMAVALQAARGINSGATGVGVEQVVLNTAVDLGACGRDDSFGFGRVDPVVALSRFGGTPLPAKKACNGSYKPKKTKKAVKVSVKVTRSGSKLRRVAIRSHTATVIKAKLVKNLRGKWRKHRTVSLRKKGAVNIRLGVGRYRLTRAATASHRALNYAFRVR